MFVSMLKLVLYEYQQFRKTNKHITIFDSLIT